MDHGRFQLNEGGPERARPEARGSQHVRSSPGRSRAGLVGTAVMLAIALAAGCRTQTGTLYPPTPGATAAPAPGGQAPAPTTASTGKAGPGAIASATGAPAAAPSNAGASGADRAAAALIQTAETQYAAAVELYRQGRLDEARAAFDSTLDQFLSTNLSIPAHPPLQHELDSLLDRIHALESDVLQTGGLNSAEAQATPLDEIPTLTFPLDAATRAAIENDTREALAHPPAGALPLTLNDEVMRYIHYFTTTGRKSFLNSYRRAGQYRAMADRIFRQVGVPTDLLYVAQLESSFEPKLGNRIGARGMWQFMPAEGRDYGLIHNHWLDERQDPEMSTLAAARFLRDLHQEFGDWYLAMAAYNAGPGTVSRAVAQTGYASFWKLSDLDVLPKVTQSYVPIVLAIAMINRDPAQYGLADVDVDPPLVTQVAHLRSDVDIRLAADCAGVTVDDIRNLNPALLQDLAPAGYPLRLPEGTLNRFEEGLAQVPADHRIAWRLHWVRAGETWASLARRFRVSAHRLAVINHLREADPPVPGTPLALPAGAHVS